MKTFNGALLKEYQVIAVTGGNGRGGVWAAEFDTFDEAKTYRDENNGMGNLHIKMPDGSWWPEDYTSNA